MSESTSALTRTQQLEKVHNLNHYATLVQDWCVDKEVPVPSWRSSNGQEDEHDFAFRANVLRAIGLSSFVLPFTEVALGWPADVWAPVNTSEPVHNNLAFPAVCPLLI